MNSAKVKEVVGGLYGSFVKDLEWITNVDSVTGNIEGSRKIGGWLKDKIEGLGGTADTRDNGRGCHVIARFKGKGKRKVLMVVHTDTVLGTQDGKRLFTMDDKGYAYGAGVGDCKASAVQMLYLVDAMRKLDAEGYAELVVFFDAEEEGGSPDEMKFARELAGQVDYAVICDTGRPGWGICTKRKSVGRYTITVAGISGHAGNAPHATANAVAELGYIMTQIHKLATPLTEDPLKYDTEHL
ncbi:MAG: M20/M25/M40 family metallo-hydrolase, partial [Deferribacteraceae bacterium]|nr:M20/M25/M40 family metallo-hydrolase [Deferribacteraceae bacterium]